MPLYCPNSVFAVLVTNSHAFAVDFATIFDFKVEKLNTGLRRLEILGFDKFILINMDLILRSNVPVESCSCLVLWIL